jgi:hypothetical protein
MSLLQGNGFIMMLRCGVFQERNTRLTCNVSMTCGKLLYMGWVLPTYNTIDLVSNGYVCHELVFDARSAVSYVCSGPHGIGTISSSL